MAWKLLEITILEYWSTGVLGCWRKPKPEVQLEFVLSSLHYSITPLLQETLSPVKDLRVPFWGPPEVGSSGSSAPEFFTLAYAGLKGLSIGSASTLIQHQPSMMLRASSR